MNRKTFKLKNFLYLFILYTLLVFSINIVPFIFAYKPTVYNGYLSVGYVLGWAIIGFIFGVHKKSQFISIVSSIWLGFIIFYVMSVNFQGFDWMIVPTCVLISPLYGSTYFFHMASIAWVDRTILLIGIVYIPVVVSFVIGSIYSNQKKLNQNDLK